MSNELNQEAEYVPPPYPGVINSEIPVNLLPAYGNREYLHSHLLYIQTKYSNYLHS